MVNEDYGRDTTHEWTPAIGWARVGIQVLIRTAIWVGISLAAYWLCTKMNWYPSDGNRAVRRADPRHIVVFAAAALQGIVMSRGLVEVTGIVSKWLWGALLLGVVLAATVGGLLGTAIFSVADDRAYAIAGAMGGMGVLTFFTAMWQTWKDF